MLSNESLTSMIIASKSEYKDFEVLWKLISEIYIFKKSIKKIKNKLNLAFDFYLSRRLFGIKELKLTLLQLNKTLVFLFANNTFFIIICRLVLIIVFYNALLFLSIF